MLNRITISIFIIFTILSAQIPDRLLDLTADIDTRYGNQDTNSIKYNIYRSDYYTRDAKDYVKGIKYANRVMAIDSTSRYAYILLGCNYHFLQQNDTALYYLNKLRKVSPADSTAALSITGKVYLEIKDYKKALACFILYKRDFLNDDKAILKNIGYCYTKTYNYSRALDYYKDYLAIDSTDAFALMYAGISCRGLKDLKRAFLYHRRFFDLDSTTYDANNQMGLNYLEQKEFDKALSYFEKCRQISPAEPLACCNLGDVKCKQEKYQEALDCYNQALNLDSSYSISNCIAQVYRKMKKFKKAIEICNSALAGDSTIFEVYEELAAAYSDSGLYKEAIATHLELLPRWQWFKKEYPNDPEADEKISDIYTYLSWKYLLINEPGKAKNYALEAFSSNHAYVSTKVNLAHALLLLNSYDKALDFYKDLLSPKRTDLAEIKEAILKDFDDLEKQNIKHPDFAKIRAMIKN